MVVSVALVDGSLEGVAIVCFSAHAADMKIDAIQAGSSLKGRPAMWR